MPLDLSSHTQPNSSCFLGCDRAQIPTHRQLSIHPFFWYRRRQWPETGDQSKNLNTFVVTPHFKMEGNHTLKSLLRKDRPEGCIPISQKHRKYLFPRPVPSLLPSLWLDISSMGLTLRPVLKGAGDGVDNIYRELSPDGRKAASGLAYLLQCLVNPEKTIMGYHWVR